MRTPLSQRRRQRHESLHVASDGPKLSGTNSPFTYMYTFPKSSVAY